MRFLKGTSMIITGSIIGIVLYKEYKKYSETKNEVNELKKLKNETIDKTKELIINTFVEFLLQNPTITLEESILKFEKVPNTMNLEEFAESKSRKKVTYIKIYEPYYLEAKKLL